MYLEAEIPPRNVSKSARKYQVWGMLVCGTAGDITYTICEMRWKYYIQYGDMEILHTISVKCVGNIAWFYWLGSENKNVDGN